METEVRAQRGTRPASASSRVRGGGVHRRTWPGAGRAGHRPQRADVPDPGGGVLRPGGSYGTGRGRGVIRARSLLVSYRSDWRYPTGRPDAPRTRHGDRRRSQHRVLDNPLGHGAFLLDLTGFSRRSGPARPTGGGPACPRRLTTVRPTRCRRRDLGPHLPAHRTGSRSPPRCRRARRGRRAGRAGTATVARAWPDADGAAPGFLLVARAAAGRPGLGLRWPAIPTTRCPPSPTPAGLGLRAGRSLPPTRPGSSRRGTGGPAGVLPGPVDPASSASGPPDSTPGGRCRACCPTTCAARSGRTSTPSPGAADGRARPRRRHRRPTFPDPPVRRRRSGGGVARAAPQGWATGSALTAAGRFALRCAPQYWYPVRYLPTFRGVENCSSVTPCHRGSARPRPTSTASSTCASARPSSTPPAARRSCRRPGSSTAPPTRGSPRAVVDVGCGDGTVLREIYADVRDHTQRGGAWVNGRCWWSAPSRARSAAGSPSAGWPPRAPTGSPCTATSADPAGLGRALRAHGIAAADVLWVTKSVIHDRDYRAADRVAVAHEPPPTCLAYPHPDGSVITTRRHGDQPVRLLGRWTPLMRRHGFLVVEAHRVPPSVTAATSGWA